MKNAARSVLLVGIIVLATPLSACRKRAAEPAAAATRSEPLFKAASATNPAARLKLLTDAMTTWEDQNSGRALTNLNQLVEARIIDQLPAAPSGQKFTIDSQRHQVVLGSM
ncbi:MAG: hypothetical protein ABMA26_26140 [Limisphaerales bacterium]